MYRNFVTATAMAVSLVFSTSLPAFAAGQATFQAKQQETRRIVVRSPEAAQRAFATLPRSTALEITCHPPTHDWCAKDFQAACDKNGGGLSTDPDGGITCSMPD